MHEMVTAQCKKSKVSPTTQVAKGMLEFALL